MTGTIVAVCVVVGIGLVIALVLVVVLLGRVRRFGRASAQLQRGVAQGRSALPAVRRRPNSTGVTRG